MIITITRTCLDRMTRRYHVCLVRITGELHKFVRLEEEDAARMQRRLHIHLCLLGCSAAISFSGGMLGADIVGGVSFTTLAVQELIDRVGRF